MCGLFFLILLHYINLFKLNLSMRSPLRVMLLVLAVFGVLSATAQILKPVKWKFSNKKLNDCEYELIFTGTIDEHWHVYSLEKIGEDGPNPTQFMFDKSKDYELIGKPIEGKPVKIYDKVFEMDVAYFEKTVVFKQKVKLLTDKPVVIQGNFEYQACTEEQCIFETDNPVEFKLTGTAACKESTAAVTPAVAPAAENSGMERPVTWTFNSKKLSDCEYELLFTGTISEPWHVYSLSQTAKDGPLPSELLFDTLKEYELIGKPTEGTPIKIYDKMFEAEVAYFEKTVEFKQKIKLLTDKPVAITGNFLYQACTEVKCSNFDEPFEFKVTGSATCLNAPSEKAEADTGLWGVFIRGFLGGLLALLTPCVFPMIPLTVSFFTKRSKTRAKGITNALLYGISIIVIYVTLGLGVSFIFGPDALNALSTNVWFNLFFFVMLIVFAASFLGAFEIVLPSRFVNKIDAQSDRGGLMGIFFMAMTLSLVSFSCTGPVIGPLLVDAAVNGGIKGPLFGMLGFSTALAFPFALFAFFPGWLNSLPKSGGWLNSVKVTLGFLELAFAFKFASNADLVVQAGIITREVFIALWIIIFGLLGMYLMGWFKLSHDSDVKYVSVPRLFFAVIVLSFTVYLIPGLWGAPLKLISGFPPPDFYSESPSGFGGSATVVPATPGENAATSGKKEHCPNQLPCFHDYDEALAYARKVNKPLMLDFTGWACVNCRKMESQIWPDPEVDKRLRNEVVLVSLYVDDKNELPEDQQTVKKLGDRDYKIKTVGNKWSYFQANVYGANTQPEYVLLDTNEKMLTKEKAHYDPDVSLYIKWLDEGINAFKNQKK